MISWYPGNPGAQSALQVSCRLDASTGTSMVANKFTIHDLGVAQYHNGAARTVALNGSSVPAGVTTFTLTSCVGITGYVNRPITRTPFVSPPAADTVQLSTIATFVNATTVTLSSPTITSGSGLALYIGGSLSNTTTRQANDASTTSTTVINSTAARFRPGDVGLPVRGSCTAPSAYTIPVNTYILSVSGTNATTGGGLTSGRSGCTIVIGDPSVTAPLNGEMMATQLLQMDLNPAVVPGVDDCANGTLEAFSFPGAWLNPGSFVGGAFNPQPANTRAVGQIVFRNAGGVSSAFVIERGALTAGDPNGVAHYDLVFPLLPIAFAQCASASSPGMSFSIDIKPVTLSQALLPVGTGKPSSAQVRGLGLTPTGGYTQSVTIVSDDPAVTFAPASEYTRLCIFPPGNLANFQCGSG